MEIKPRQRMWFALDRHVLVVAIEGEVNDWAAYIGAVEGTRHEKEVEDVFKRGTKLPRDVAEVLFPQFARIFQWRR